MKLYTLLLFNFCVSLISIGQNDTIQVAKNYHTILFFESPIDYSPIGNRLDFILVTEESNSKYNKRIIRLTQNLSSIKKNIFTNLKVITEDGNVYSFVVKSVETPTKTDIKVTPSMATFNLEEKEIKSLKAIGNKVENVHHKPIVVKPKIHKYSINTNTTIEGTDKKTSENEMDSNKWDSLYTYDKKEYLRKRCYYHQFDKPQILRYGAKEGGIYLWLESINYEKNHLFFQFKIQNKQSIDFDIDFINYTLATNYKKSSANQETLIKPAFVYKQPKKVKGKTKNNFVIVFEKFTLEKNMVFLVDIKEDNGARTLNLNIDDDIVNNPTSF